MYGTDILFFGCISGLFDLQVNTNASIDRLASVSEQQLNAEEKKVAAIERITNSFLLEHLPEDQKAEILRSEAELMQLEMRKRKLLLQMELKELEGRRGKK